MGSYYANTGHAHGGMVSANANFGPNLGSTIDERRLAMFSSSAQPGGGLQNVSLSASLGGGLQSSYRRINPQTFGQSPLDYSGMSGMQGLGGMHSAPAEMQAERWAELNHLQTELQANRTEETRIRQALQVHESVIYKNREELNRYRDYMETRDGEMRQMMQTEEERLQMVLDEYKQRYDRERIRLQEALVKAANCAQIVSDGLSECLAVERQLFGYSPEELRTRRSHPADGGGVSLLQAITGMSLDGHSLANSYGGGLGQSVGGSMGASMSSERFESETLLA